jgi:hypothetical protein
MMLNKSKAEMFEEQCCVKEEEKYPGKNFFFYFQDEN